MVKRRFDDFFPGNLVRFWPVIVSIIGFAVFIVQQIGTLSALERTVAAHHEDHERNILPLIMSHEKTLAIMAEGQRDMIRRLERIERKIDRR